MGAALSTDAVYLARLARARVAELERQGRGARPVRGLRRVARSMERARQGIARRLRAVVRDHWDVGLFDVLFGSLKAFGVYPALYFAGLAWTIPLMEYAPLNTQLWTAGYLFARGKLLSTLGRWRYGHCLDRLDALRDRLLRMEPRDARAVHRFHWQGVLYCVRVRRSRWLAWRERWRGRSPAAGVVRPTELRRMLTDAEFRHRANGLRGNPYLYERVLIEKILATPADRPRLLARAAAQPEAMDAIRLLLGDGPEPIHARLASERDLLAAALRRRLGNSPSSTALGLRWLHASHRRAIHRLLGEIRDLEYRLLADLVDGGSIDASPFRDAIRARRGALRAGLERATLLLERVGRLRSSAQARGLLRTGLREARACGLAARRARIAARCSAGSAPAPTLAFLLAARRMDS